jgi:type II secretory pathway pseudopilin PulG
MINLLPKEQQRQLRAARTNVLLFRYSIGMVLAVVFIMLAALAAFVLLNSMKQAAENTIETNQTKVGNFGAIQSEADSYRKDLTDAKTLFDSQIQYSKIYLEIARVMPAGTALDSLDLNPKSIGTPLTLPVKIKGESQAASLLTAFQRAAIFNNTASFGALTINTGDDSGTYPYVITINVTINKEAIK